MKKLHYHDIERHFTAPCVISPFYADSIRIPRKLKKKAKAFCGCHWSILTNAQRLWWYLDGVNPNYKTFLVKQICSKYVF